jgi:hypothetical protein
MTTQPQSSGDGAPDWPRTGNTASDAKGDATASYSCGPREFGQVPNSRCPTTLTSRSRMLKSPPGNSVRSQPTSRKQTPHGALQPLSYELAGRGLTRYARSHSCRPATFSRPTCLAPSRLFASVPPCSVSKSVANPLSDKDCGPCTGATRTSNTTGTNHSTPPA